MKLFLVRSHFLGIFLVGLAASWISFSSGEVSERQPVRQQWTVGELQREALVYLPVPGEGKAKAPVVFGFHGHGGSALNAARSFRIHEIWSEAIVVYLQGVPTPGRLSDPEGKRNGWQSRSGDQGDRDLIFFDTVLVWLKEKQAVDEGRIYATGHSNGGGFTYLLWAERPGVLAAVAPSAAAAGQSAPKLTPKPVLHLAGTNDRLVKFEWQQRMIEIVKKVNGCSGEGTEWASGCTLYPSERGTPLVTFLHSGGHRFPAAGPELMVRFFKEHNRSSD